MLETTLEDQIEVKEEAPAAKKSKKAQPKKKAPEGVGAGAPRGAARLRAPHAPAAAAVPPGLLAPRSGSCSRPPRLARPTLRHAHTWAPSTPSLGALTLTRGPHPLPAAAP